MIKKSKPVLVLGPGHSTSTVVSNIKKNESAILAFQRVFPHCHSLYGIVPDLWVSGDPYAFVEGFEYLLSKKNTEEFGGMKILVPSFFTKDLTHYRRYCGTTPLMRIDNGWQRFQHLLAIIESQYDVEVFDCTSTKFIGTLSNHTELLKEENIFGANAFYRFMHKEVIFGTVKYDSESVIGDKFKWGLENKLSSVVFPVCYYLGAKKIYIAGFDMVGPRFYNNDERHPWNDETQQDEIMKYPLASVSRWLEWSDLHGMEIFNAVNEELTLLAKVLPHCTEKNL